MLNIRSLILSVALVIILMLTVRFVTARTEVVSAPSSDTASLLDNQERSANRNYVYNIRSYRSGLGECFDVSLSELASCRIASQAPVPLYRSRLGECFDVSLSELAICRNAGKAPAQIDRSTVDACANLPPNGPVSCTNARPAPARLNRSPVDACANLPPNGPVSCTNVRLAHAP